MIEPTLEQRTRLAINRDWTTDVADERNARYLLPLNGTIPCGAAGQVRAEQMAEDMAEWVFSAIAAQRFSDATPDISADAAYFQALVDARRMVCDPDYARLFG